VYLREAEKSTLTQEESVSWKKASFWGRNDAHFWKGKKHSSRKKTREKEKKYLLKIVAFAEKGDAAEKRPARKYKDQRKI